MGWLQLGLVLAVALLTVAAWTPHVLRTHRPVWPLLGTVLFIFGDQLRMLLLAWDRPLPTPLVLAVIVLPVAAAVWWFLRNLRLATLLARGDADAALAVATRLTERRTASATARHRLGQVHLRRHEWDQAIGDFDVAEQLAAAAAYPPAKLSRVAASFGDRPLSPLGAACRGDRGIALWRAGRLREARPLLESARSALREDPFLALQLCELLLDLGQTADAAVEMRRVQELGPTPPLREQIEECRARLAS